MLCLPAIVFLNLIQLSWVILLHKFQCFFFNELEISTSDSNSIKEVILDRLFQYSDRIDMTFKLIYANDMEIELLNVPVMTPLILTEAIHYNKANEPFARNKFYFLPEHYHLEFSYKK